MPAITEKWRKNVDDAGVLGALLTDLYQAFDYTPYDFIITKLEAFGFHIYALRLIRDYLSNRKQRIEDNDAYRLWKDIIYGVPQGSILGTLLFNIHLVTYSTSWKTFYTVSYVLYGKQKKESYISVLETSSSLLFGWLNNKLCESK